MVTTVPITSLRDIIVNTLSADSELYPTPFKAILDKVPQQGKGENATPEAFYTLAESQTEAGKLKPTIAVLDRGDNPSPNGAAHNGFVGFPLVYGYAPDSVAGEAMLSTLERKLHTHFPALGGGWYGLASGAGVVMKTLERQLLTNAEDFGYPGRQFAIWRIECTFVRR